MSHTEENRMADPGEEEEESPETFVLGNPVPAEEDNQNEGDNTEADTDAAANDVNGGESKEEPTAQDNEPVDESTKIENEVKNDQDDMEKETINEGTNQGDRSEETNQIEEPQQSGKDSDEGPVPDNVDDNKDNVENVTNQNDDNNDAQSEKSEKVNENQDDKNAESDQAKDTQNDVVIDNQDDEKGETEQPNINQDSLEDANQADQGKESEEANINQDQEENVDRDETEREHTKEESSPVQDTQENTTVSKQETEETEQQEPATEEPDTQPEQPQAEPEVHQQTEQETQDSVEAPVHDEPSTDNIATGTEPTSERHETDPHAPSPVSTFDTSATATVKFVLMPSGQVATMRCHLGQSFSELKGHFASELKMPTNLILILYDGKKIEDDMTLGDLGVGPNGTIQLEIQSADPINHPIKPVQKRTEYHMPDVITVRVQTEDGTMMDVVVEIERALTRKPFLGGYRHKKTGVEYHHASAQTMAKQRPPSNTTKYCRDTQTVQQRHQVQQTTNATSSQMSKIGVYVSNMQDKMLVPGKYTTAEEHHKHILDNVIIIQKYYRRWLAMRSVDNVRSDKIKRMEWERQEELRKKKKVPTATLR